MSWESDFNINEYLHLVVPLHTEVNALKEENSKLKSTNDNLNKTKKNLEKENKKLKAETESLRKFINNVSATQTGNSNQQSLEEKCRLLETENAKLQAKITKDTASFSTKQAELDKLKNKFKLLEQNKVTLQIVELLEDLKKINNQASTKACKLAKQTEENKCNYEQELEKYIIEYDKHKANLTKQGISVQKQNFPNLLNRFRKLRHENDIKRKNAFKIAYEIDQNCKNKSEGIQKYISQNINEIKLLIEEENKRLIEFKKISFISDFNTEQKQYQDLLKIANEETNFLTSLLQVSGIASSSKAPNTSKYKNTYDKDAKIFNNNLNSKQSGKTWKSKSFNNLINKDLYEPVDKQDDSIVLLNFAESDSDKNDLLEVKFFLMKNLSIKDVDDIAINRLGHQQVNHVRPILITPSSRHIFNYILKQSNQKHFYNGANVQIRKYDQFQTTKKEFL